MLCYPPLESTRRPLMCRHDRVTREVGRVGLLGRDRGRRASNVSGVVPVYLYYPASNDSVSLGV